VARAQAKIERKRERLALDVGAPTSLHVLNQVWREVAGVTRFRVVQDTVGRVQLRVLSELPSNSEFRIVPGVTLSRPRWAALIIFFSRPSNSTLFTTIGFDMRAIVLSYVKYIILLISAVESGIWEELTASGGLTRFWEKAALDISLWLSGGSVLPES